MQAHRELNESAERAVRKLANRLLCCPDGQQQDDYPRTSKMSRARRGHRRCFMNLTIIFDPLSNVVGNELHQQVG